MRTGKLLAVGALAIVLLLGACTLSRTQTRVDSFTLGEAARLEADVEISRITIRSGVAGELRIESTLRAARSTEYQVTQEGDSVKLSVHMQPGFSYRGSEPAMVILVTVPPNIDLSVKSSSGYIYLDEVVGHIALATSSGGMQLSDSEGQFELQAQTGSIICRRMRGIFDVRDSIGPVSLLEVSGTFNVETETGTVTLEGTLDSAASHHFLSRSGSLDLRLLGEPNLRVDVSSESGVVRCALALDAPVTSERGCKGTLGSGTGQLEVRTYTGSIIVH